jgi:hypothetical protein
MNSKELPLHKRIDLHFVWIGLPVAIVIGAGAWLGVPGLIIPMALLLFAFAISIAYVWVMLPIRKSLRVFATTLASLIFLYAGYLFWFVFAVDIAVRFVNSNDYPLGGDRLKVAAVVTNRGKPTSLTHWKATLRTENGKTFDSIPVRLIGDSVSLYDEGHQITYYALPDCDLRIETSKALQTGDTDYGIASFVFHGLTSNGLSSNTLLRLEARDMLGRTIRSRYVSLANIQSNDIFACKEVKQP